MAQVIFNGSKSWAHNLNDLRERWNIRRENPIKYVVPVNLFKQDISSMNQEELLKLLGEMNLLKAAIQSSLEKMKSNWWKGNVKHTDEEYLDTFKTDKSVGAHIQAIGFELAKYKNEYRNNLSKHFFDVCREKLSKEMFSEIMNEANERLRNA